MANEYDKILRETFKYPQYHLLKELLQVEVIKAQPLPAKVQQTIIEREADTVLEVVTSLKETLIVHIEWQSTNDSRQPC